jgi:hypothetical protein
MGVSEKKTLTLENLGAFKSAPVVVDLPELDLVVKMRVLPADIGLGMPERLKGVSDQEKDAKVRAAAVRAFVADLLGLTIVNDDGVPEFDTPEKMAMLLSRMPYPAVDKLFNEALKIQGWKPEQAGDAKNASSETVPPAVSPTA